MGKKVKIGKQRKDKFYKLAKETGYRSRASFKLIQLNRKFEFLQKSRILIDLCAAPGGWLQVAQQSMPVSSVIIGVDLVSIKPIPNIICLQEDITTDKCKQVLKRQLKMWKADTVLHDGAPNVGKNWLHDAFAQAHLTLAALRIATEFLVRGGWFITKIFRSKDYNALIWVFRKLFKKVHVTKPQASRNESAEIFVVCEGYIAPDHIDPKFLDSSYLFKDVIHKDDAKPKLLQFSKRKSKVEGYENGDASVISKLKASDFIFGDNHLEMLNNSTEIIFDDEDIKNHKLTTEAVTEYCKDLKVLGKGELRSLLNWRKNLHEAINSLRYQENLSSPNIFKNQTTEELEIEEAFNEAENMELATYQEIKRKKKKILKERKKLIDKINLKMIIKNDEPIVQEDVELFNLSLLKSKKDLLKLEKEDLTDSINSELERYSDQKQVQRHKSCYISYNRYNPRNFTEASAEESDENEELKFVSDEETDEIVQSFEMAKEEKNPLRVDLYDEKLHMKDTVAKWYDKDDFCDVDEDEDIEIELLAESANKKFVSNTKKQNNKVQKVPSEISSKVLNEKNKVTSATVSAKEHSSEKKKPEKRRIIFDPEGLALGSLIIQSTKKKRDVIESAYNRYASNDENLPDWFVKDEEKHCRKKIPVSSEMVQEYKERLKEINARPIKKVIEAKARKKRKALKRLEKARKRAEAVTENLDMSEKEKVQQLKSIYKKALQKKDNKVTYVVAKKGLGRRVKRPPGIKGRYKMVDKRLKKDIRSRKLEGRKKNKTSGKARYWH